MALSSAPSPECVAAVHAWSAANRPGFFVGRGNGLKKLTGSLGRIIDASIDSREVRAIVDIGAGMYYPKGRRDEYVKAGPRTAPPLDQPDMMVGGSGTPTLAACLGPDLMRTAGWTPSHSARGNFFRSPCAAPALLMLCVKARAHGASPSSVL